MSLSKLSYRIIGLSLLAIWLAACAAPTPTAPPPAATTAPVAAPTTALDPTAAPGPSAGAASAVPGTPTASASGQSVTFELVPALSEASYAIREQLAQRNLPNDAVGKTQSVSGSVTVNADGTLDSAKSKFTVEAATIKSDQAMRDGYVSRNILQVSQYPQIVFVPTAVSGLPATLPTSGAVTFQVTGDLTVRDVTKPVTWEVTGTIANGEAIGTATTSFTFEDFNLAQPKVPVVLSVVDKITLTMKVDLKMMEP